MGSFSSREVSIVDVNVLTTIELKEKLSPYLKNDLDPIVSSLLSSIPEVSNYTFKYVNYPSLGRCKPTLISISEKFHRSNSDLKTHLEITNLQPSCRIGLAEYQYDLLQQLLEKPAFDIAHN